jgi:type VI secretion system secreted protein Hcp
MASCDYKLVIESVRGEMKREGTHDGIDVQRFEFGAEVARDGASGLARQRRRYSDVKFTKLVDRASPTLQSMLATNTKIRKATLSCYKGDGDKRLLFYQVTLSDAYISAYRIIGEDFRDEFGAIPRDEFSINFRKIDVDYTKQNNKGDADGTISFSDQLDSVQ